MLVKKILAVDIGSKYIKLIYVNNFIGGAKTIKASGIKEIQHRAVNCGNIIDTSVVAEIISEFIKERNIAPQEISFVIHGTDVAIRYFEVPRLSSLNIRKSINWNISQYHSNYQENYIVDFQIIETINSKEKKAHRVLTAMVSKEKINKYIDISQKLGLKLKSIDLATNCISRTINHLLGINKQVQNIAVIDIGFQSTQFLILHKGMIFLEKELNFGLENITDIISSIHHIGSVETFKYLREKFNVGDVLENNIDFSIISLLDRKLDVFSGLIRFFESEKHPCKLDRIYLSGGGCEIMGIKKYVTNYLNVEAELIEESLCGIKKMKAINQADSKYFTSVFGLSERKEF